MVGIGVGLVLATACCWWIVARDKPGIEKQLLDGSVVQLGKVVFDRGFRVRTGDRWRDHLGMILPKTWAKKLGAQSLEVGGSNTLAFCVSSRQKPWAKSELRGSAIDSHGCELGLAPVIHMVERAKEELAIFEIGHYPRGERRFELRIYERLLDQGWGKVIEFPVTNANPSMGADWRAESLPTTKKVGDASFTLVELKSGVKRLDPKRVVLPLASEWGGVSYKLSLPRNWELIEFHGISDAFGQTVGQGIIEGGVIGFESSEFEYHVNGGLCDEDAIWKLQFDMVRKFDFPSEELWTIRGIPIPSERAMTSYEAATNVQGVAVRFVGICGAQCPTPDCRKVVPNVPVAVLACTNLPPRTKLRFAGAVDQLGREAVGLIASPYQDYLICALRPREGATTVDLTFAVTKYARLEYLAKPVRSTLAELDERERAERIEKAKQAIVLERIRSRKKSPRAPR
jgi:hypothetical protein